MNAFKNKLTLRKLSKNLNNRKETCCWCSNLCITIDPLNSISTAHAAGVRLRRAHRAQGCSRNVGSAPAFSLDSFVRRPKRRKQEKGPGIACMSATLPKRDSCSLRQVTATGAEHVRYDRESIRPLLMEPSVSIFPLRPPPLCLSFSKKHLLDFLMAAR